MLSSTDLERLIAVKRREIEKEKTLLGLISLNRNDNDDGVADKENSPSHKQKELNRTLSTNKPLAPCENTKYAAQNKKQLYEVKENIPADLERAIRRYIGLPVMLKTGEYSPNNPLLRSERDSRPERDVFLGLGEYEERKKSLRKLRQQEYREYLDQQAKKKREEKEKAERELRLAEEKERQKENAERERRLASERERQKNEEEEDNRRRSAEEVSFRERVDTAIQCDSQCKRQPLSVAVQTDGDEFLHSAYRERERELTRAERELSPRTAHAPAPGDRTCIIRNTNRDKLLSNLRHTYMPSIFDADVISKRNLQVEQEAAAKREYYQQELKHQIMEQQRIREERKARERMLEMAEMRRLEEQLRLLNVAKEKDASLTCAMIQNAQEYDRKRKSLQKDIDCEKRNLQRSTISKAQPFTAQSDSTQNTVNTSKLPFYYQTFFDKNDQKDSNLDTKMPFSTNVPKHSIFSSHYDVDSYLRKNLNPTKQVGSKEHPSSDTTKDKIDKPNQRLVECTDIVRPYSFGPDFETYEGQSKPNLGSAPVNSVKLSNYEPSFSNRNNFKEHSDAPIPVLRHSPKVHLDLGHNKKDGANLENSEAMRLVEDKWKVPVVQKNILTSLPNDEGKNVSILTQLGSIRRQLQMEQLKLDKMLESDEAV